MISPYKQQIVPWQVLVVDDDPEHQADIKATLAETAFNERTITVISTHSLLKAHSLLTEKREISLLILNMQLEGEQAAMNFLSQIRHGSANITLPIIVQTKQLDFAIEKQLVEQYGINGYYQKADLKTDRLYSAVAMALRPFANSQTSQHVDNSIEKQFVNQSHIMSNHRDHQIQLITRISQQIGAMTTLPQIFDFVVAQVKEQFNYSYIQLLQYDSERKRLNLVAGSGDVGRRMQAEGLQLPLGPTFIGTAAALGLSQRRAEVDLASAEQSPLCLPETKAEMAIPIKLGNQSVAAQITALQGFLDLQYDGLILAAIDLDLAAPLVQSAMAQGCLVSSLNDFGEGNQTAFITLDDYGNGYKLGHRAGVWAASRFATDAPLQIAIFNDPALPQVVERERGIMIGLEAVFGANIQVVAKAVADDPISAFPVATGWLEQYPDLSMILGINDNGALAGYAALISLGRNDPDTFFIGGIDGIDEALAAIAEGGAYQATVDQPPRVIGRLALHAILKASLFQEQEPMIMVESSLITRDNLADFLAHREQSVPPNEDPFVGVDLQNLKIGMSVMNLNNPFFAAMADAASEEAARLGIQLDVNDPKPLLGILDIQVNEADALTEENQLILESLCNNIAVAIENVRLLEEANIFGQFAAASIQGFGIATLDGQAIYANQALADMVGISPTQIIGQPIFAYYAADYQANLTKEVMPEVMDVGQWTGETTLYTSSGQQRSVLNSYFLIRDEQGQPLNLAVVVTDISQRKQTETELEARLRELNNLQRMSVQEGWQEFDFADNEQVQGYLYDQISIQPILGEETPNLNNVKVDTTLGQNGENGVGIPLLEHSTTGIKPISVRDTKIGEIGISANQPLTTEDEIFLEAVSEQVAQALDNARLFKQTQDALFEAKTLYDMTVQMSAANDYDGILQAIARSGIAPGIHLLSLSLIETDASNTPISATYIAEWHAQQVDSRVPPLVLRTSVALNKENSPWIDSPSDVWLVSDTNQPEQLADLNRAKMEAIAFVPLYVRDQWLGLLTLSWIETQNFSEKDRRLYQALARQLALTLDNQALLAETQRALMQVEQQYELSQRINQVRDSQELVEVMADLIVSSDFDEVVLFDVEQDQAGNSKAVVVNASWHKDDTNFRFPLGSRYSLADNRLPTLLVGKETRFISDVSQDASLPPEIITAVLEQGVQALGILPLRIGTRLIGALTLLSAQPHAFSQQEVQGYRSLMPQLATTVENRRLLEETASALQQANTAQRQYTLQSWSTYRQQEKPTQFEKQRPNLTVSDTALLPAALEAIGKRQTFVSAPTKIANQFHDSAENKVALPQQLPKSQLVVPITIRDSVIGLLGLENFFEGRDWTVEEIDLVETIVKQMADVAENLRLVEEAQERAAREKQVNAINEKIQATQSLEEALQVAVRELGTHLSLPRTSVQLKVDEGTPNA